MQKFTRVPEDTFERLQLNAGILVRNFDPVTGAIAEADLMGATTGGISFASNPSFTDFGEDIDNVPNNMMELKHIVAYDPAMSGTFLTVSSAVAKTLVGAADVAGTKVTPRNELLAADFTDLWWVGDFSDVNTGEDAGFLAIHLINALNTSGFQIQSGKNDKGRLAFEFHGHYSIASQDVVPFEIYVKSGSADVIPTINLDKHYAEVGESETLTLVATAYPSAATVTWTSDDDTIATVADGVVTGVAAGNTIITASITNEGVTVNDTCTVVVTE